MDSLPKSAPAGPRAAATWILVPAVVMSLGWGLRGYIGGGPFGAMIPGSLVALLLCQYLGYSARTAAVVVACSALGIGFGGEMTYGQTLGLLRERDTFAWGLTGTTLKGAVWGLLGGAVLGLGFVASSLSWRHLILALLCLLVGTMVGIHFINQPKLIYFSDPINRPRDESWAGFLLGALALLAYLHAFEPRRATIASRFAWYGTIGGAIGFGGGSLLLALRFHGPQDWGWLPYWKFMEFAFGFVFGAALGGCTLHLRERLVHLGAEASVLEPRRSSIESSVSPQGRLARAAVATIVGVVIVWAVFVGWEGLVRWTYDLLQDVPENDLRQTAARVLLGYIGLGCTLMLLSRRWPTVAWQVAMSVTIVAAAIDWQRDLLPRGGIDVPGIYRFLFVNAMAALSILFVAAWQTGLQPRLATLFLFAASVLMGIGYMMGLALSDLWWPDLAAVDAAGGRGAFLWAHYRSEIVVHLIFTTLLVISLVAAWRERRAPSGQ